MITIYIYDENLHIIAKPLVNSYEEFMSNPQVIYHEWDSEKHIADTKEFKNPIIVDGELRSKKREEEILLDGKVELLYPGEIIKDGKIEKIGVPEGLYKPLWESPAWIEDAALEECQEYKRIEMKGIRDNKNEEEIEYNGNFFDGDLNSKNKLFQASQIFKGSETEIDWITADNKVTKLIGNDLENIVSLFSTREQQLFTRFADRLTGIESCKDVESVKNIKWRE